MSLKQFIEKIISFPVDVKFLKKNLPERCRVVQYSELKNKHRSEVFKNLDSLVVIIPMKGTRFGHFVVLLPRKHHIEYFSSLGQNYFQELKKLDEPRFIFDKLLGKNYIYNRVPLQKDTKDTNSCWIWVITRTIFHRLKLREFVKLFQTRLSLSSSDEVVTLMALTYLQSRYD